LHGVCGEVAVHFQSPVGVEGALRHADFVSLLLLCAANEYRQYAENQQGEVYGLKSIHG
jgi:hypothetical protein